MTQRDSRQLLLDAASREFGQYGFAGARVARIAQRAGVNKQLIFYYFGSKAGLHRAVTASAPTAAPDRQAAGPATEGVRRGFAALFETLRSRPDLVASFVQPPGASDRADTDVVSSTVGRLEDGLAGPISAGQGRGYFRDDVDPALVARLGLVLATGFLAMRPRLTDPDPGRWVREASDMLARMLAW